MENGCKRFEVNVFKPSGASGVEFTAAIVILDVYLLINYGEFCHLDQCVVVHTNGYKVNPQY